MQQLTRPEREIVLFTLDLLGDVICNKVHYYLGELIY